MWDIKLVSANVNLVTSITA